MWPEVHWPQPRCSITPGILASRAQIRAALGHREFHICVNLLPSEAQIKWHSAAGDMMMTIVSVLPLSVVQMEQCLHPTLQHFTLTLATPDTDWQTSTPTPTDTALMLACTYESKLWIYVDHIWPLIVFQMTFTTCIIWYIRKGCQKPKLYVCIYSFPVMIQMCFKAYDRVVDHCCVPGWAMMWWSRQHAGKIDTRPHCAHRSAAPPTTAQTRVTWPQPTNDRPPPPRPTSDAQTAKTSNTFILTPQLLAVESGQTDGEWSWCTVCCELKHIKPGS